MLMHHMCKHKYSLYVYSEENRSILTLWLTGGVLLVINKHAQERVQSQPWTD